MKSCGVLKTAGSLGRNAETEKGLLLPQERTDTLRFVDWQDIARLQSRMSIHGSACERGRRCTCNLVLLKNESARLPGLELGSRCPGDVPGSRETHDHFMIRRPTLQCCLDTNH